MKFIATLSDPELITLEQLYQNGPSHRLRQRAHIILMNHRKIPINSIVQITSLDRDTISVGLDHWEKQGIAGLYDLPRSGRTRIFSIAEEKMIIKKIEDEPRSLKKVTAEVNDETKKRASVDTVKRIVKKRIKSGRE